MTRSLILFSAIVFIGCGSGSTPESADSGTSISVTGDENPCLSNPECAPVVTYPSGSYSPTVTIPCGWDKATNVCYTSRWCEPSVASRNPNGYNLTEDKLLRPQSAVCPAGVLSYTYPANSYFGWGSEYTTKIKTPAEVTSANGIAIGPTIDATTYLCTLDPVGGEAVSC